MCEAVGKLETTQMQKNCQMLIQECNHVGRFNESAIVGVNFQRNYKLNA